MTVKFYNAQTDTTIYHICTLETIINGILNSNTTNKISIYKRVDNSYLIVCNEKVYEAIPSTKYK